MPGLNQQDMRVLERYAQDGNRQLYWNYLAQHEGSDGYGLLALGVVRNDNMPGRVANEFAQSHARSHDGVALDERGWERFGIELIQQDLQRRQLHMRNDRPDLALNLPVNDVQRAHDQSFRDHNIDPNAWTPRQLLDAARRQGGDAAAERAWHTMLDNSALGVGRAGITAWDVAYTYNDGQLQATRYLFDLGVATGLATQGRPNTDPNVIGATNFYYAYDRNARTWSSVSTGGMAGPMIREVSDPRTIAELDDARAVRLERQEKATQFHPLDPHRTIARSPVTLAQADSPAGARDDSVLAMADGTARARNPTDPGHGDHQLHAQINDGVRRLHTERGLALDDTVDRVSARLLLAAKENNIDRADHVLLSNATPELAAGHNIFVVKGSPADPAMQRAMVPTDVATGTSVADSFRQVEALNLGREQQAGERTLAQSTQDPTQVRHEPQRIG